MRYLRYAAAICAILFGLALGYILVFWWVYLGVHRWDWRWVWTAMALTAGIATFLGANIRYLTAAMVVAVLFQARSIWFYLMGITGGTWGYSITDIAPFTLALLPMLGLLLSLIADASLRKWAGLARRWTNLENR